MAAIGREMLAATAAAVVLGLGAQSAVAATPDDCLTPVAPHEPVCNPALAQSPWPGAHRGSYAQASSPFPGPSDGRRVTHQHLRLPQGMVPVFMAFSAPYADGGPVLWASGVSAPENRGVIKVDPESGALIDQFTRPTGRASSGTSGAYNVLDRDNRLIVARGLGLEVYGDREPGRRRSPIALLEEFELPPALRCRDDDRLIGITMLWDGMVAFATELGVVGVVPRQPERMTPENLHTISLNAEACRDGTPRERLEQVSNSIAGDEHGGVYVVTSSAQYKLAWDGRSLGPDWRAAYETGGVVGGARLGSGSGTTPTLMGTDAAGDKLVVITDGRPLMHLVLFWRDEIPSDWEPIAPGRDRRIACEVPVRYGDPNTTESVTEQSVLVRGYASVVVNNDKSLGDVLSPLPAEVRPLSEIASQTPGNAQPGLERIDWDPATRTCRSVWSNRRVVLPNGVPGMSTETGLVYGIGVRPGSWGLEGIDFETGRDRLWVPSGPDPTENSFFAATEVGPDGAIWTGTLGGVTAFRTAGAPGPPKLACRDRAAPSVAIGRARISRRLIDLRGTADDRACGDQGSVRRVSLAIARVTRGRCRFLNRRGRLGRVRACAPATLVGARGTARWSYRLRARLAAGRYRAWAVALDAAGNPSDAQTVVFRR